MNRTGIVRLDGAAALALGADPDGTDTVDFTATDPVTGDTCFGQVVVDK